MVFRIIIIFKHVLSVFIMYTSFAHFDKIKFENSKIKPEKADGKSILIMILKSTRNILKFLIMHDNSAILLTLR